MKKITFTYLAGYLIGGGIGFAFIPELTLNLFLSNGEYGDIMPRVVGMFMMALGGLVAFMTINQDFRYYINTIYIRTAMTAFLFWLYFISKDPLFIVFIVIVLIGLLPSWYTYLSKRT
jgi:uncharacterized protein YjeT (DUF2065 family)